MNFNQCLKLKQTALLNLQERYDIVQCPHMHNRNGFSKHMSIKEHPRLINEIPRGSKRYNTIKKMRPASLRGVGPMGRRLSVRTAPLRKISKSLKNHGSLTDSGPTSWGRWLGLPYYSNALSPLLSGLQVGSVNSLRPTTRLSKKN